MPRASALAPQAVSGMRSLFINKNVNCGEIDDTDLILRSKIHPLFI
jgi:hypothetical protein